MTTVRTGVVLEAQATGLSTITKFGNSLKGVNTQAMATATGLKNFNSVTKVISTGVKSLIGPLALGGLAVGFRNAASSMITYGDELDKASIRTNVNADTLDRWYRSANLADVSQDRITKSLVRLNTSLGKATSNTDTLIINNQRVSVNSGAVASAFDTLGISLVDSTGKLKSNDQVMREIADSVQKLGVNTETSAAIFKIFGERGGRELLPFLTQGSEGVDRFSSRMGPEFAKNSAQFDDNMELLGDRLRNFELNITAQLLPTLLRFQEFLLNAQKNFEPFIKVVEFATRILLRFVRPISDIGLKNVDLLSSAIRTRLVDAVEKVRGKWIEITPRLVETGDRIRELITQISTELQTSIEGARDAWNDWKPRINEVILLVGRLITQIRGDLQLAIEFARLTWNGWRPSIETVIAQVLTLTDKIRGDLQLAIEFARNRWNEWNPVIQPIIDLISNTLTPLIKSDLALAISFVRGTWEQFSSIVGDLGKSIIKNVVPALTSDLSIAIEFVSDTWDLFVGNVRGLYDLTTNLLVPAISNDLNLAIEFVRDTWNNFNTILNDSTNFVNELISNIKLDLQLVILEVLNTWDKIKSSISEISQQLKDGIIKDIKLDLQIVILEVLNTWDKIKASVIEISQQLKDGIITDIKLDLRIAILEILTIWDRIRESIELVAQSIKDRVNAAIGLELRLAVLEVLTIWDRFREAISNTADRIQNITSILQDRFTESFNRIESAWNTTIDNIRNTIDDLGKILQDIPNQAIQGFKNLADQIRNTVGKAIEDIVRPLQEIQDFISGGFRGLRGNSSGGSSGDGPLSRLGIPGFQSGGIVTSPTLATVGEAGPEAIIPLSRLFGRGSSTGLSSEGGGLLGGIQQAIEYVKELRINTELLNQKVNDIGKSFKTAFSGAARLFDNIFDRISRLATGTGILSTIFKIGLLAVLVRFRQQILPIVLGGINLLIDGVEKASNAIRAFSRFIDNLPSTMQNARNGIDNFIKSINIIPGIVSAASSQLAGFANGINSAFRISIDFANRNLRAFYETINDAGAVILSGINNIKQLGLSLSTSLAGSINNSIASFKNWSTNLILTGNPIQFLIGKLAQIATSIVQGLGSAINTGIDNLRIMGEAFATQLPQRINQLIIKIREVGLTIIDVLRNSLTTVTDFIRTKASQAFDILSSKIEESRDGFNKLKNLVGGAVNKVFRSAISTLHGLILLLSKNFPSGANKSKKSISELNDELMKNIQFHEMMAAAITNVNQVGSNAVQVINDERNAREEVFDILENNIIEREKEQELIKQKMIPATKELNKERREETKNNKEGNDERQKTIKSQKDLNEEARKGVSAISDTGDAYNKASESTKSLGQAFNDVKINIGNISNEIRQQLKNIGNSFKFNRVEVDNSTRAYDKNRDSVTRSQNPIRNLISSLRDLGREFRGVKVETTQASVANDKFARSSNTASKSATNLGKGLDNARKGGKGLIGTTIRLGQSIFNLVRMIPGLNLLLGGFLALRVIQSVSRWIRNLIGNASEYIGKLNEMNETTGFSVTTLDLFARKARQVGTDISVVGEVLGTFSESVGSLEGAYEDATEAMEENNRDFQTSLDELGETVIEKLADVNVFVDDSSEAFKRLNFDAVGYLKGIGKELQNTIELTDETAIAFDELAIEVKNEDGTFRDQEELLSDVATQLFRVKDESERAAIATALFGESSKELFELLDKRRRTIDDVNVSIEQSSELKEEWDMITGQVRDTWASFGNYLFNTFVPGAVAVIRTLDDFIRKVSGLRKEISDLTLEQIEAQIVVVNTSIANLTNTTKPLRKATKERIAALEKELEGLKRQKAILTDNVTIQTKFVERVEEAGESTNNNIGAQNNLNGALQTGLDLVDQTNISLSEQLRLISTNNDEFKFGVGENTEAMRKLGFFGKQTYEDIGFAAKDAFDGAKYGLIGPDSVQSALYEVGETGKEVAFGIEDAMTEATDNIKSQFGQIKDELNEIKILSASPFAETGYLGTEFSNKFRLPEGFIYRGPGSVTTDGPTPGKFISYEEALKGLREGKLRREELEKIERHTSNISSSFSSRGGISDAARERLRDLDQQIRSVGSQRTSGGPLSSSEIRRISPTQSTNFQQNVNVTFNVEVNEGCYDNIQQRGNSGSFDFQSIKGPVVEVLLEELQEGGVLREPARFLG